MTRETDKPVFHTGTPERKLVYAWEDVIVQLEADNERLREQVASLQASSGYEASIAQVEIERQRTLHRISIDGRDEIERGLREDNERLRAALERTQIGVNHIALYRTDRWPDYGTDNMVALEKLGAGQEYDMWCCWNAAMCARAEPKT
jgi:hypothetical protein